MKETVIKDLNDDVSMLTERLYEQSMHVHNLEAEIAELKNVVNAFKDAYVELTNSEVHFDSGIAHIANLQLMDKFDAAFDLINRSD